ncbi:hypothetical protein GEMRC1_012263 [Eukaryota sp. GEM-RC1]
MEEFLLTTKIAEKLQNADEDADLSDDDEEKKPDLSWVQDEFDVVFTTLTLAGLYRQLNVFTPDILIIDEVGQATEPEIISAFKICPNHASVVIVGDEKQLPPVVLSRNPKLAKSLMESHLNRMIEDRRFKRLNPQYRQYQELWEFSNKVWYDSNIQTEEPCRLTASFARRDFLILFYCFSTPIFQNSGRQSLKFQ